MTGGVPQDLDDASIDRIARSFYVVRMVRYALLLVALTVFLVATLVRDAPGVVAVAMVGAVACVLVAVVATRRRYVRSRTPARDGTSPASPTG